MTRLPGQAGRVSNPPLQRRGRGRFGQSEFSEPSRFLQALPEEAIERNAQAPKVSIAPGVKPGYRTTGGYAGSTGHGRNGGAGSPWWGGGRGKGAGGNGARPQHGSSPSSRRSAEPETLAGFGPGDRVAHDKFGAGQVINVKNLGDDQDVTVKFQDGQIRTLSANMSRLRKR